MSKNQNWSQVTKNQIYEKLQKQNFVPLIQSRKKMLDLKQLCASKGVTSQCLGHSDARESLQGHRVLWLEHKEGSVRG